MTTCRFILLFILILAMLPSALATDYKYPPTRTDTYDAAITITAGAEVLNVIDGDTLRVRAHMWPGQQWEGNIRLFGIDTPELRGSQCPAEKVQGILARDTLVSLVPPRVLLANIQFGKFAGRYVAAVMDGGQALSRVLMKNGVGRPYFTGKRKPWCNESAESIRARHQRMTPSHPTDTPAAAESKVYLQNQFDNL